MARKVTISDGGGLSGFGSITVYEDTAEVMLEALAAVLGARIMWEWQEQEPEAACGSVTVSAKEA